MCAVRLSETFTPPATSSYAANYNVIQELRYDWKTVSLWIYARRIWEREFLCLAADRSWTGRGRNEFGIPDVPNEPGRSVHNLGLRYSEVDELWLPIPVWKLVEGVPDLDISFFQGRDNAGSGVSGDTK